MQGIKGPLEIEREFERINQLLRISPASRYKLKLISDFLLQINNFRNKNFLRSYYILLHPHFTQLIKETDFSFTNPAFIRELIHITDLLEGIVENPTERSELIISRERLVLVLHQIIDTAQLRFTHVPAPEKSELHNSVNIPLLENELLSASGHSNFSSVRKLFVELSYSKSSNGDIVQLTNHLGTEQQKIFEKAIRAARTVVTKITGSCPTKKMVAMCWFEKPDYLLGESLMAGLAVIITVEIMNMMRFRNEYSIHDGVAITGGIDTNGNLLAVDNSGLLKKVEACFFSSVRVLVVPDDQYAIAAGQHQQLREQYPEIPALKLIPVKNIFEVLNNSELSAIKPVAYTRWFGRKVWDARRAIALIVLLTLLGILTLLLYGPIDRNPVKHIYKGEYLVIQNQFGDDLDYIKLNPVSINQGMASADLMNFVDYLDIDEDGINEVFYSNRVENYNLDEIYCKSVSEKKIIWKAQLRKKLIYPDNPMEEDTYSCGSFRIVKDLPGFQPFLIVLAKSPYFPCYLTKLDARTGKEIEYYVHSGGLNILKLFDVDNDGVKDILVTGINNSYKAAVFVVFDPRAINGHSPAKERLKAEGIGPGSEKYYITFPASPLAIALKEQHLYGNAHYFDIYPDSKKIRIHITEAFNNNRFDGSYYIYLNFNMRLLSMNTGTPYDRTLDELLQRGRMKRFAWPAFSKKYLKEVLYWDGYKFDKKITKNGYPLFRSLQ